MTLSTYTRLLRTAASTVMASSASLRGAHRSLHHHFSPALHSLIRPSTASPSSFLIRGANIPAAPYPSLARHFFSPSEKVIHSDEDLVELIDSKIKNGGDNDQIQYEAKEYDDGCITLMTDYRGESIEIEVLTPLKNMGADFRFGDGSYDGEINLSITITRLETSDSTGLEFLCTASSLGELRINELYYLNDLIDAPDVREGSGFKNLDANMQNSFKEYLLRRGIMHVIAKFRKGDANKKSYINWLENVKEFIAGK